MMNKAQFLNRFERQPDGAWTCIKPMKIDGPNGPFMIKAGASFSPGALLLGIELAKELDKMAAEQRLDSNSLVRAA
jgi:hypothetical protein